MLVVVTHSAALAERFPRRYEMNEGTLSVTRLTLVTRSLTFHWRTNLAVLLGVAAASAVLAGALVVGDSVRGSLREIALGRLGRTETRCQHGDLLPRGRCRRLREGIPTAIRRAARDRERLRYA